MSNSVLIVESRDLEVVAEALIERHHPHLTDARLLYLQTDARVKCQPKVLGPFERYLSSGSATSVRAGYHFALVVNVDVWAGLDDGRKAALVDHLLAHCGRIEDDHGRTVWVVNPHLIEEFPEVIRRHGLWRPVLQDLGAVIRQLPLLPPVNGAADVARRLAGTSAGIEAGE